MAIQLTEDPHPFQATPSPSISFAACLVDITFPRSKMEWQNLKSFTLGQSNLETHLRPPFEKIVCLHLSIQEKIL